MLLQRVDDRLDDFPMGSVAALHMDVRLFVGRPPLLGQAIHEIGPTIAAVARPTGRGPHRSPDEEVGRLAWMLRPFRAGREAGRDAGKGRH